MSVLESMRSGSDSTFMQVVLGLVVVSFVGWYAVPQGDKSSVVATVNGVKIMDTLYSRTYRQALAQAERQYSRTLSNDEQAGIGEQVKQQLISNEVQLQEAKSLGVEVSDTEIARAIAEQPWLQGEDGKFSMEVLSRFLKRQGLTRADYEDELRKQMTRDKLQQMVFTAANLSEPELKSAWEERNTRVDIRYVKVNARSFQEKVQIEDGQVDQFLVENEEEVAARYAQDKSRLYDLPERLELLMIRVPATPEVPLGDLMPQMNTLKEQLDAGGDFAALAAEHSKDPSAAAGGAIGEKRLDQLGTEEAAALLDLTDGQISRVVTTPNDARLYKVVRRIAAETQELEAVKTDIADKMIREEGAPTLAAAFAEDELLPKWTDAGPPADLLQANDLLDNTTGEIPIQFNPRNFFGPPEELLNAVRGAEVGSVLPEVYEASGQLWVAQLVSRTEPDAATFEIERDTMVEPVLAEKRMAFFTNWVADAKAQANIQ